MYGIMRHAVQAWSTHDGMQAMAGSRIASRHACSCGSEYLLVCPAWHAVHPFPAHPQDHPQIPITL